MSLSIIGVIDEMVRIAVRKVLGGISKESAQVVDGPRRSSQVAVAVVEALLRSCEMKRILVIPVPIVSCRLSW